MTQHKALLLIPLLCGIMLCWLGGCTPETVAPVGVLVDGGIATFHRSLPDMIYSAISGRDCSIVRLDEGQSYCRPVDPPVPPQPYCTRSLARVDCWADPKSIPGLPVQVAQGPHDLTPQQNHARLARWPASLN